MRKYKLYKVIFQVGYTRHEWNSDSEPNLKWRQNSFEQLLLAKDLDEVITLWPEKLLKIFPFDDGTGGGHYSKDPVFGDSFKYISITLLNENILSKDSL